MSLPNYVANTDTFFVWLDATNNLTSHVDNTAAYIQLATNATPRVSTANAFLSGTFTITTVNAASINATGNVTASAFSGNGVSLTTLNASALTSGTVPVGQLPSANTSANGAVDTTTQSFAGAKTFTDAVNAASTLGAIGVFTASANSTLTGAVTMSNTASITGAVNALSTLGVTGVFTALANSTLTGAVVMNSTLSVTGQVNALSNVGITGAVTLSNTVSVTGPLFLFGTMNTTSTLGVGGAFSALSTSAHTGAATFSSTVLLSGTTTANATIKCDGANNGRIVVPVGADKWSTV